MPRIGKRERTNSKNLDAKIVSLEFISHVARARDVRQENHTVMTIRMDATSFGDCP